VYKFPIRIPDRIFMRVFFNRFPRRVLCIGLILAAVHMGVAWAGGASDNAGRAGGEKDRPWIMVSLARGVWSIGGRRAFSVIKEMSGNPNGINIHFSRMTPELIADLQPAFIILSPQGTPWCRYSGESGIALQNFLWMLPLLAEEQNIPILGICGGHQALALSFGGKVGPIRAGEDDCLPYSRDRQSGVVSLKVNTSDPLFSGVDSDLRIVQSHYDEVKVLPKGFVVLASDRLCRIQIMRHGARPVYGIQGHPECFSGNRPDGGILIRNFLHIARAHNKTVRQFHLRIPPNAFLWLGPPKTLLR
jgi:GMP synthase (glutamine-hydrolysing)